MTDHPITFSAPMIHALWDGRKSQTRRIVKGVPNPPAQDNVVWHDIKLHAAPYLDGYCGERRTPQNPRGMSRNWCWWTRDDRPGMRFDVGGAPGDRLWVKEAWRTEARYDHLPPSKLPKGALIHYEAYGEPPPWAGRYRHARFMPRRFSRLTLIVTDVRVQRVQDISEADAEAEGAEPLLVPPDGGGAPHCEGFRALWNSIHGPDAWDRNDWVCALTFDVHRKNIGEMADA